jgi:hypothetical protein
MALNNLDPSMRRTNAEKGDRKQTSNDAKPFGATLIRNGLLTFP